jgi:predicted secreted protein
VDKMRSPVGTIGMTAPERVLGLACAGPSPTDLPGWLADDEVPLVLAQLFCGQAINDGGGMIKLELPHIVERGVRTLASIEVNWPMVLANAVARLYVIADFNAVPLLAKITLPPDIVPPHLAIEVRLEVATHVRAVVQCGNGTLLQVKRWVWVMPLCDVADPARGSGE